jgi:hypothetical protein
VQKAYREAKVLFTSYFGNPRLKGKRIVAISQGVPKGYDGPRYLPLAPSWALVKEKDHRVYVRKYVEQLSRLDPEKVFRDLGEDAILLCWEKPGAFCHRQLAAEWLEKALGISVPEYFGQDEKAKQNVEKCEAQQSLF